MGKLHVLATMLFLATTTFAQTSQTIHPDEDKSKCLDVRGGVFENGTPVQIYDCNGTPAQQWESMNLDTGFGRSFIRLAGQNFCLDAGSNPYFSKGVKLKIWECYDLLQQNWLYSQNSGKISLRGVSDGFSDFCIDVPDGRFENSNQVQMWECRGSIANPNQKWSFE
ncbi:carbohydrate-binding module family 13 protein [Coprinopsis sp. MPI-PUGE-AT-0042]|nr:carbohydrate-binding module family 13 protein [Coprinopsis sp. MPI-PUGE-AT-0042]